MIEPIDPIHVQPPMPAGAPRRVARRRSDEERDERAPQDENERRRDDAPEDDGPHVDLRA